MKYLAVLFCIVNVVAAAPRAQAWRIFTATAYSVSGKTASGHHTVEGRTMAADPALLPLGTRVEIRGAGEYSGAYTVQDSGRRIVGRKIDVFIENPAEAKKFGKKQVRLRIVQKAPAAVKAETR